MNNNSQLGFLFKSLVLIVCMASFGAWFFWNANGWLFIFLCGVLMAVVSSGTRRFYTFSGIYPIWFLILVITIILTCIGMNINGYISVLCQLLPVFLVICLKSEYKEELLGFLNKSFRVMILISLIWFFLYLIKISLPHFQVEIQSNVAEIQTQYIIYYLFIIKTDSLSDLIIPRFQFIFYEPGYFGCLMAVFLYLNEFKFDKKHWENYVYVVSLLFSLSVGGFVIGLFGYIAFSVRKRKNKVQWLLTTIFLFGFFYFAVVNYNGGDNLINNGLFARLEYDASGGTIVGNSRFSENVRNYFWNKFIYSDDIWFGMKETENVLTVNNVDYLSFIIQNGLLALVALFVFLYYPCFKNTRNRYGLICFAMIYTLIFAQCSFSVFWTMNIVLLVLGVNRLRWTTI